MLQPDMNDWVLHGSEAMPVRLGMVGCGGISHRHAPAAAASAEVAIVACCDTRTDVAENWAATYGCENFYGDYRAMVAVEVFAPVGRSPVLGHIGPGVTARHDRNLGRRRRCGGMPVRDAPAADHP